ncbi:MAG: hypothetical protein GY746_10220 [Gammaproteobacteria bacterium]|nr:hypothetical protein [Gammaproteobacteria bacterium]
MAHLEAVRGVHTITVTRIYAGYTINKNIGKSGEREILPKTLKRDMRVKCHCDPRSKSRLAHKYQEMRAAGKIAKVALVAIARKIATIINAKQKIGMALV